MPKFDIEFDNDIRNILLDMGMQNAMTDRDYHVASPEGVEITHVLHSTHFKVNEDGAEASATTAVIEDATAWYDTTEYELKPFPLDHQFIYLITEKESGAILFIGCVKSL